MSTTSTSSSIETLVLTDAGGGQGGGAARRGGQPGAVPSGRGAAGRLLGLLVRDVLRLASWPTTTSSRALGDVKVVVDPASATLLTGSTLDYKDGLQGAGFSINNPNATRTCGCGQSFS